MTALTHKIDFTVVFAVNNANPNGDPLNGNRPRETYDGFGEVSDVCLKRKIRNRLMDLDKPVFVQSDDNKKDDFDSLQSRANSIGELKKCKDKELYAKIACATWLDVRSFGQVFAFKGDDMSVGVRGPVSIQCAKSISSVEISSLQITKSVNSVPGAKKTSDTMGMKHRIPFGLYVFNGSINCQLAEKTRFSEEDAENIKKALCSLFQNDASSARPDGSMEVIKVYWWEHNNKNGQASSAKVHRALKITPKVPVPASADDYNFTLTPPEGMVPEILEGE